MRKTQFGTLAAAGMALAALSCGGPQEPSPGTFDAQPVLVTDRLEYTAVPLGPPGPYRQWEFTLQATLTNPSSRPLYVNRCTPDSAEPTYGVVSVPADAGESAYNVRLGVLRTRPSHRRGTGQDARRPAGAARAERLEQRRRRAHWRAERTRPAGLHRLGLPRVQSVPNRTGERGLERVRHRDASMMAARIRASPACASG